MPYINGLELAERITRDYPAISVILITGNNEFEYARKAVKLGVCDYIVKPFEKEELILSLLKLRGYLLALIRFDAKAFAGKETDSREQLINWENLIARMLADKLDIDGKFSIFHDFENNIVTLMRFDNESDIYSYKGYEFADIIQIVKNQLGIGSAIALSPAQTMLDVKKAYERALGFLA